MGYTKSFDINHLTSLTDEAFIHHCFARACRCVCSPSRAKHYLARLASGASRADVVRNIIQESEYPDQRNAATTLTKLVSLDGELFLHEAYRKILGRPVDNRGFEHYLQRLSKGEKKERILYDLVTSSEGQVRRIQHSELNDFVAFLTRQDDLRRPIVLKDIRRLLALRDDEFVQKAYRLILKREADATGLSAYQQALRNGLSRIRILHILACSDEGRRFHKTLPVRLYFELRRLFK
ncbi:MAG: DUF4214 domain-containing protein [Gammaproteobacteria bacterium]|nr:DUF4214 domain-containing protein [Gammaproteobacteria bacterium]MBU1654567.1 DUF4214 domain-containing protein [Gammaproteobacteria bacterium]MBU1961959.1 DUF4214 domain-containing protein [Gammaproteobacteria bacterium]